MEPAREPDWSHAGCWWLRTRGDDQAEPVITYRGETAQIAQRASASSPTGGIRSTIFTDAQLPAEQGETHAEPRSPTILTRTTH